MPKGYVYAELEVTDPAGFEAYRTRVSANIASFGGRYLVRGGDPQLLEGDASPKRVVLLEFDSPAQAAEWYNSPSYQELLALRLKSAGSRVLLLSGA